jgi:hypothetical protein
LILGTQTYGKGSVQNAIDLDRVLGSPIRDKIKQMTTGNKPATTKTADGKVIASTGSQNTYGQLNLTIAKFYRISGNSTQHKGVTPDIQFPSLIPLDKYGEDTEPSAMPFDVIDKSDYVKAGDFTTVLPQLKQLHDKRMATSDSYKYMLEDIAAFKKRETENSVTLNEAELKKQRDIDDQKAFDNTNLRRVAMAKKPLLEFTDRGIYCVQGKFYIDPWKPVDDAVITHAHADHAYVGHKHYLAHHLSREVLLYRLGEIKLQTIEYGETVIKNGVQISMFPAGHVIGSAQIRVEYKG